MTLIEREGWERRRRVEGTESTTNDPCIFLGAISINEGTRIGGTARLKYLYITI